MENRRITKACARCRTRKIKCDLGFPSCGSCSKVGAECFGFNALRGIAQPRSTVSHLEDRVALLEIELAKLKSSKPATILETVHASVDGLTTRLADTISNPGGVRSPRHGQIGLVLTSSIFLSPASLPPLCQGYERPAESISTQSTNILSIPRHVIDIMLQNYCSIYLPQYPCVDEIELYASCNRIYTKDNPSAFDYFSVAITLAISANTLIKYNERRATAVVAGFWALAIKQLGSITESPWQSVQALQLMTHFGILNPILVNCDNCATVATRMCFQLGLHRELPLQEQSFLGKGVLNSRRRLFWTSYGNEAALQVLRHRPFIWSNSAVIAKYPETSSYSYPEIQSSTTDYIWSLRQMSADINLAMHYPNISHEGGISKDSFPNWFKQIHNRLDHWFHSIKQDIDMSSKIEFYEIHYRTQIFSLNTSTPRCPAPTIDMRRKALKSALMLINDLQIMHRLGKLFNILAWSHWIVEFGLGLLETVCTGLEFIGKCETHLDNIDMEILAKTIHSVPVLLQQLSVRYPPLQESASHLESLSAPVLQCLEIYGSGDFSRHVLEPSLKLKLRQLLLHSLSTDASHELPAEEGQFNELTFVSDSSMDIPRASPQEQDMSQQQLLLQGPGIIQQQTQTVSGEQIQFPTLLQNPMSIVLLETDLNDPLASALTFEPSWSIDNAFQQWYIQPDPNTDVSYTGDDAENMFWDVTGLNTDDILTALLEDY